MVLAAFVFLVLCQADHEGKAFYGSRSFPRRLLRKKLRKDRKAKDSFLIAHLVFSIYI